MALSLRRRRDLPAQLEPLFGGPPDEQDTVPLITLNGKPLEDEPTPWVEQDHSDKLDAKVRELVTEVIRLYGHDVRDIHIPGSLQTRCRACRIIFLGQQVGVFDGGPKKPLGER